MTLADEIITYRAKNRITQKQMAEKCNLTTQTINVIEKHNQKVSKLTEAKIRLVLQENETS